MENLPLDMINLILHQISNYDLNQYALTSKTNYQIVNRIWRQKFINEKLRQTKFFKSISIEKNVEYWQNEYVKIIKIYIFSNVETFLDTANQESELTKKQVKTKILFEFIYHNKFILNLKSINGFKSAIINKLIEFSNSFSTYENQISNIYLPLFADKTTNHFS